MAKCNRCSTEIQWKELNGRNQPCELDLDQRHHCTFYSWLTSFNCQQRLESQKILPPKSLLNRLSLFLTQEETHEMIQVHQTNGISWKQWNTVFTDLIREERTNIFVEEPKHILSVQEMKNHIEKGIQGNTYVTAI